MNDKSRPCPICGHARAADHAPFCSQRCRDRDLARWFGDGYAIAGRPALPEDVERDQAATPDG